MKEENFETPIQTEEINTEVKTDTAAETQTPITIPIKFNKEIKELCWDEAIALAQKGMKYEAIADDFALLKELAQKSSKNVNQFLQEIKNKMLEERRNELFEKCGDEAFVEHIMMLEGNTPKAEELEISQVKEFFPQISSIEDLPLEVVEKARHSGRDLLDEYLRFCLIEKRNLEMQKKDEALKSKKSLGSQISRSEGIDEQAAEFLKGLWK